MVTVLAFAWIRRRLAIRRAGRQLMEEMQLEAEAMAREQEIIAGMEADFLGR